MPHPRQHRMPIGTACAILALALAASGCATFYSREDPNTGISFLFGRLQASVYAEPAQISEAAEKVFKDMQIRQRYAHASGLDAEIIGRTALDKKVVIRAKGALGGRSYVFIKVGALGSETLSRTLLDSIQQHLPPPPGLQMGLPLLPDGSSPRP